MGLGSFWPCRGSRSRDGFQLLETGLGRGPFGDAGRVGVWIKSDSVTLFDDLAVEELK